MSRLTTLCPGAFLVSVIIQAEATLSAQRSAPRRTFQEESPHKAGGRFKVACKFKNRYLVQKKDEGRWCFTSEC